MKFFRWRKTERPAKPPPRTDLENLLLKAWLIQKRREQAEAFAR
jgi:hypothetical protein